MGAVGVQRLEGGAALEKKLLALERTVGKKIVRKAVRAGAKPVLRAIKASARSMVGGSMGALIAKNLQTRAFKKQKKGQFGAATRFKPDIPELTETSADGQRNFIPADIEFGHEDRAGGQVPAIPFMRSAFDATKRASEKAVVLELKKGILLAAKTR